MYPGFRRYVEENGPEQGRVVYDAIAPGRDSIEAFVFAHGIDCDLERSGSLQLAATPAQVAELPALVAGRRALGFEARADRGAPRSPPDPQYATTTMSVPCFNASATRCTSSRGAKRSGSDGPIHATARGVGS